MTALASVDGRLLDIRAAAAYVGLPVWTLRGLVVDGIVRRVILPGRDGRAQRRIWIDRTDLDLMVEKLKERNVLGRVDEDSAMTVIEQRARNTRRNGR